MAKPKLKDINKYCELDEVWYSLGIELEVDDRTLDSLGQEYDDHHQRLIKMFGVWLQEDGNPTYGKLIKALLEINKRDVAESLSTQLLGKPSVLWSRSVSILLLNLLQVTVDKLFIFL